MKLFGKSKDAKNPDGQPVTADQAAETKMTETTDSSKSHPELKLISGQQISQAVTQGIQRAAPPAGVTVDATGTPASPSLDSPQVTAQIQNAALAQRMRASEALGLDSTIQTGPRGLKTRAPRRRKMLLGA